MTYKQHSHYKNQPLTKFYKRINKFLAQAAEAKYTVFVGGSEVTDWHLTLKTAETVCNFYKRQGYNDVAIVDTESNEQITTTTGRQFPAAN